MYARKNSVAATPRPLLNTALIHTVILLIPLLQLANHRGVIIFSVLQRIQ